MTEKAQEGEENAAAVGGRRNVAPGVRLRTRANLDRIPTWSTTWPSMSRRRPKLYLAASGKTNGSVTVYILDTQCPRHQSFPKSPAKRNRTLKGG